MTSKTLLLIFVTMALVSAQTFQYSRGWTNGKRASLHNYAERNVKPDRHWNNHIKEAKDDIWENRERSNNRMVSRDLPVMHMSNEEVAKGISASLSRISPCQMNKLKYILQGWSLDDEWLYLPCKEEEDNDPEGSTPRLREKTRSLEHDYSTE